MATLLLEELERKLDTKHKEMDDKNPPWGQHHGLNQALPGLASDSLIHSQMIRRRETIAWKMAMGDNGYRQH